jgi:hypothetical protein
MRIPGLGHCGTEYVKKARIQPLSLDPAEPSVHAFGIPVRELLHGCNAELLEAAQYGRAHRDQVIQFRVFTHGNSP